MKYISYRAFEQAEKGVRAMVCFERWMRDDDIDLDDKVKLPRGHRERRALRRRNYFMCRWYQMDQMRRFVRRVFGDWP